MTAAASGRTRALLIAWYCLAIGSVGALHPMLSLVLSRRGASPRESALTLALFPLGLLLSGPAWGWASDRSAHPLRTLSLAVGMACLGASASLVGGPWWAMVPGLALLAFTRAASSSLGDVHTLRLLGGGDGASASYGAVRLWGSLSFIVALQVVAQLFGAWPRAPLAMHALMLGALALLTLRLPAYLPQADERPPANASWTEVLRHPLLGPLLLLSVLHVGGVSTYDNLFSIHAHERGLADGLIATAVGLGVAAEVAVMAASPWLLGRWSPRALLLVAVLAGVPRWAITASATAPALLVGVQVLHGATFGLWWVGGIAFVAKAAPPYLRGSAQATFVASGFGLGNLLALLGAAWLLPAIGTAGVFWGVAGSSALAALVMPWALRFGRPVLSSERADGG